MKRCTKCNVVRPKSRFSKRKASPDGLQSYCKLCVVEYDSVRRYNLTTEQKRKQLDRQGWKCPGCLSPLKLIGRGTDVDHCHDMDAVRGILCSGCNKALGSAGDDPATLIRLAQYRIKSPYLEYLRIEHPDTYNAIILASKNRTK